VTGCEIPAVVADRRAGDPPSLVASSRKAVAQLGWKPNYPRLAEIVAHAWNWHQAHRAGYGDY